MEEERGRVIGGRGVDVREGARGRRESEGRVNFYFDGKGEEEDSPSKSDDDSDYSEEGYYDIAILNSLW